MSLKALFLNCTLKKSPEVSNTEALLNKAAGMFHLLDVETEVVRISDYNIKFGVSPDEGDGDEWPGILEKVNACDILIIAMPIWMGVRSSICQMVMERLDGSSENKESEKGQYILYNKVCGVIITGNEDGAHDCAANTLFNLSHFGGTVPPNCDSYWVGKAGGGESYIKAGGERHLYTNKTIRFMTHNIVHFARILKENPIPTDLNKLTDDAKSVSDEE